MRVLVTGGAGFIGSHVVDRLLAAGHEPVIFDIRRSPYRDHAGVEMIVGDLLDCDSVRRAAAGCDAIAHLAASADVGVVAQEPRAAEELNARGTLHVLEAARTVGARMLYASTIWAYSDVVASEVDEDTGIALPSHLYTATKVAGEMYCRSYEKLYGVETTILRFGIPYGPRARPAAVLPIFVNKALSGEPLTIAGDGLQSRRFVYVEDLAEGVVAALRPVAAGRVYNLVGQEDTTVRQIADAVRDAVGDVEIVHTEGRAGDFAGVAVSGERATNELGWTASTSFAEGVRHYVAWHERNADDVANAAQAGSAGGWLARILLPLSLMVLALIALAGYVGAMESIGLRDGQAGTVGIVAGLVLASTLAAERFTSGLIPWGIAALCMAPLLLPSVAHGLHVVRLDLALLLLGAAGAGLVLVVVNGGRRVLPVAELSQDAA